MRGKRRPDRRKQAKARRHYWLTPKAWNRRCSHSGADGSIAVRPADHSHACESCVERLNIQARGDFRCFLLNRKSVFRADGKSVFRADAVWPLVGEDLA